MVLKSKLWATEWGLQMTPPLRCSRTSLSGGCCRPAAKAQCGAHEAEAGDKLHPGRRFRNRAGHNDLAHPAEPEIVDGESGRLRSGQRQLHAGDLRQAIVGHQPQELDLEAHVRHRAQDVARTVERADAGAAGGIEEARSEEHTSELQSLMRI